MNLTAPVVDYRKLRPKSLSSPQFQHLKLLIFWPVFGLIFLYLERYYPAAQYYPMHCFLDDVIPFCELFVFPYLFWFLFLVGMHLYTLLYDIEAFRKLMHFIILTYTVTAIIYFLFPTCQELRPAEFARDNFLTRFMTGFYAFDTHTNVCPSLHVVGSLAVMFTGLHAKRLQTRGWRIFFIASAALISISTVFLKQHSVLDILAALVLCFAAYPLCFSPRIARRVWKMA